MLLEGGRETGGEEDSPGTPGPGRGSKGQVPPDQGRRLETIHPEINPEQSSASDKPANSRIRVLYSNVRSIVNKIDELKHSTYNLKPNVICICETWTNDSILNAYLSIEDYSILCRKDRNDTDQGKGGGLLVYVKTGSY